MILPFHSIVVAVSILLPTSQSRDLLRTPDVFSVNTRSFTSLVKFCGVEWYGAFLERWSARLINWYNISAVGINNSECKFTLARLNSLLESASFIISNV